jgi:fluoride exporter
MKTTLLIGLGSFIGGMGRYLIWKVIQTQFVTVFPYGTFTVNVVGCFLIGVVFGWSAKGNLDPTWQLFLTTGILGGFTTFSAFSIETINMLRSGNTGVAFGYVALSLLFGFAGTIAGFSITKL